MIDRRRWPATGTARSEAWQLAIGSGCLAISPGIAGVLAARSLGPNGRGELAVAIALASVAGSVGMRGLDTAILSQRVSPPEAVLRSLIIRRSAVATVLEGTIAAVVALVVVDRLSVRLGAAVAAMSGATTLYLLTRSVGIANGRTGVVRNSDVASSVTLLALAVGAWRLDLSPAAYAGGAAFALLVGCVLGLSRFEADAMLSPLGRDELRASLAVVSRPAWVARTLQVTAFRLDRVVLAAAAGVGVAGIYAAVVPVAELTVVVSLQLAQLSTVRLARSADPAMRWYRLGVCQLAIAASLVLGVFVVVFAATLMALLYGAAFEDGVTALRVLAIAAVVSLIWRLSETELFARQRAEGAAVATAVAAAVVLTGTWVLADHGASGASTASLAGYSIGGLVVHAYLRRARCG